MSMQESQFSPEPYLTLVDLPGHPRLESKSSFWLERPKQLSKICVVVDAAGETSHFQRAAHVLFFLLTNSALIKHKTAVKIIANKSDLEGALSLEPLQALLERELDGLRASRAADVLVSSSEESHQEYLGYEGEPFSFEHVVNPITWLRMSALTEPTITYQELM